MLQAMNKLTPNTISKVQPSKMAFKQMEYIAAFLQGASNYGLRPEYSFQTVDLYEEQNIPGVVNALCHLKRLAEEVSFALR